MEPEVGAMRPPVDCGGRRLKLSRELMLRLSLALKREAATSAASPNSENNILSSSGCSLVARPNERQVAAGSSEQLSSDNKSSISHQLAASLPEEQQSVSSSAQMESVVDCSTSSSYSSEANSNNNNDDSISSANKNEDEIGRRMKTKKKQRKAHLPVALEAADPREKTEAEASKIISDCLSASRKLNSSSSFDCSFERSGFCSGSKLNKTQANGFNPSISSAAVWPPPPINSEAAIIKAAPQVARIKQRDEGGEKKEEKSSSLSSAGDEIRTGNWDRRPVEAEVAPSRRNFHSSALGSFAAAVKRGTNNNNNDEHRRSTDEAGRKREQKSIGGSETGNDGSGDLFRKQRRGKRGEPREGGEKRLKNNGTSHLSNKFVASFDQSMILTELDKPKDDELSCRRKWEPPAAADSTSCRVLANELSSAAGDRRRRKLVSAGELAAGEFPLRESRRKKAKRRPKLEPDESREQTNWLEPQSSRLLLFGARRQQNKGTGKRMASDPIECDIILDGDELKTEELGQTRAKVKVESKLKTTKVSGFKPLATGSKWPAGGGRLLVLLALCLLWLGGAWRRAPEVGVMSQSAPMSWAATSSGSSLDETQTSGSSDEFSRAVMATMSTQSPLAADLAGGTSASGNGTRGDAHLKFKGESTESPLSSIELNGTSESEGLFDRLLNFGRIFIMSAIIVGDICGNSLVILSVCRHSKLRVTTNWFVVSLACADILVALFAMTFNASVIISGRWLFKPWVCDFWNSCDVLASTASILHLCCISIDRYIAIMRPLDYPMKITTRRVVYALCAVWISSALLSYIPIFTGIYTTAEHIKWLNEHPDQCEFVVNRVYAIVSSSISFWIPCCIMVFTYYRIYREATRQEKFIYKAQAMMQPAPLSNHHHHGNNHSPAAGNRSASSQHSGGKQRRSKSVAVATLGARRQPATSGGRNNNNNKATVATTDLNSSIPVISGGGTGSGGSSNQLTAAAGGGDAGRASSMLQLEKDPFPVAPAPRSVVAFEEGNRSGAKGSASADELQEEPDEHEDSNSGQSTPTKRSISKMKREHKAAKTLGIIMGVFILCWLPFFSWYTPMHICGHACDEIVPRWAVTILFWIGYFNSTLNPIIYAYFNHEFRDAFKKTLQWIFCCCQDLKCLRVNRPNDNQHYNCTYRSTQEIGLVSNG